MIREIIRPVSESYTLRIPKEYINTDVEILILPFEYPNTNKLMVSGKSDILKRTAGILSGRNIDPLAWQKSIRDEYER